MDIIIFPIIYGYRSLEGYNINGYSFNTQDKKKSIQNFFRLFVGNSYTSLCDDFVPINYNSLNSWKPSEVYR